MKKVAGWGDNDGAAAMVAAVAIALVLVEERKKSF
jgi:hypothetical protein